MKGDCVSGRFIPSVRFPIYIDGCKSARIQVEPILCQCGYGIHVKVILVLTAGTGENKYEYERIIGDDLVTQASIPNGQFFETAYEYFEGFYYNKISQDVVVPLTAMMLKTYCSELIGRCGLDLSDYFLDTRPPDKKKVGY
jgi:hypothetical protein